MSSTAIFVVGPHRSGTSALTRVLNLAGCYVGEPADLLPPTPDNPTGYWESRRLVELDDLLLAIFGTDWRNGRRIDVESLPAELYENLRSRALGWMETMDRHGVWVCKDPRLCLTAGFWLKARPDAACVVGVRHPAAAVASLMRRTGDRVESGEEALLIWRRHLAGALAATAGRERIVVDYDTLLERTASELGRIVGWLRRRDPAFEPVPDLEAEVERELDPSLRRHRGEQLAEELCENADLEIHAALLAGEPVHLDRMPPPWNDAPLAFDLSDLVQRHEDLRWEVQRLSVELRERGEQMSHLTSRLEHSDHALESLERSRSYRVGRAILAPAVHARTVVRRLQGKEAEPGRRTTSDVRFRELRSHPRLSLVMAVGDETSEELERSIESVESQLYLDWQLSIGHDDRVGPGTLKRLRHRARRNGPRVRLVHVAGRSTTIADRLAAAAGDADGEFLALIDAGGRLDDNALLEIAIRLEAAPDADVVYADHDTLDEEGNGRDPFFKPDFSPELLLSSNYLCGLTFVRRSLIRNAGGIRSGFDGSHDFDLYLRVSEQARRLEHVRKVLYHRPETDPEAVAARTVSGREALRSALARRDQRAEVEEGRVPGTYRVRFRVPDNPAVSVIIPTAGRGGLLKRCVDSVIEHTRDIELEILVVGNNCRERETLDYIERASKEGTLRYIEYNVPFNFARINNHAVRHTSHPYLLLLNDDVEATHAGWLDGMLEYAQQESIGAVGARLLYPDRTLQHAGMVLGIMGGTGHAHRGLPADQTGYFGSAAIVRNCSAVTGACLMTRRHVFDEVGGLDEELPIAFNDVDFCLKVRREGYRVVFTPYATLYHHESRTRGRDDTPANTARFRRELAWMLRRWDDQMLRDPYYNPNLTLWREDFSPLTEHDIRTNDEYFRRLRAETGLDGWKRRGSLRLDGS